MRVKDLLEELSASQEQYGDAFLDWDIYTEQCHESDKVYKRGDQKWEILKDSEGWEYFKCFGFWTKYEKEKAFTINVNY